MRHAVEVLILTSDLDFATDRVCRELNARNRRFLRLNREQLPMVSLVLDPVGPELTCRYADQEWRVGRDLRAVWWRQGTFDRETSGVSRSVEEQLARTQWGAFMRNLMVFDSARWTNHPAATYRAECKAVQLNEAARLGFNVPTTLMTNDVEADAEQRVGSKLAMKSIDTLLLRDGSEQLFGYTTLTDWRAVGVASLRGAPVTVQRALEDKIDLRVTVLGDQVWSVAIYTGGKGICGDWRLTSKIDIQIEDWSLPPELASKCILLTQGLGLRFGAIDLVFCNNQYWFIEINPTGEWGWLDTPERPIAAAIAEDLICP